MYSLAIPMEIFMRYALLAMLTVFALALGAPVSAQNFSGWCVDNGSTGCMARFIPFYGNSISWCEEHCTLTNPVSVNRMEAKLYDYTCKSDHSGTVISRVLIHTKKGWDGKDEYFFITNDRISPIVRCP